MHVKFNVPVGSGLSITQYRDDNIELYIRSSFHETLSIEMNEETAVKIGYALLKMTGNIVEDKLEWKYLMQKLLVHQLRWLITDV